MSREPDKSNFSDNLKSKLGLLPEAPGVYLHKNKQGKVIYVGKAKRLNQRVRSYFHEGTDKDSKTQLLIRRIDDFDYIVTETDTDALVLENQLIKEYRPLYNIRLKDDKQYPYIKITLDEPYPRVKVVRRIDKDKARYFGPFTDVNAMRHTLNFAAGAFQIRTCHLDLPEQTVTLEENSESSHVRMQVSGHGQGNTSNAAEFFEVTHALNVNGAKYADHHLWKEDCATNVCTNQFGTYLFSRAGWCPGQEVAPKIFNFASEFAGFSEISIDYNLQSYTNQLNTGYNDGSHTEPHYRIHGFLVEESSSKYDSAYFNLTAESLVPVITGEGSDQVLEMVEFNFSNTTPQSEGAVSGTATVRCYINEVLAFEESDTAFYALGSFTAIITGSEGFVPGGNNKFIAEIMFSKDANPGDNVASAFVQGTSSTDEVLLANSFHIKPNPSSSMINVEFDNASHGSSAQLYSLDGRLMETYLVHGENHTFNKVQKGLYLIKLVDKKGLSVSKKVIVIE